MSTVEYLSQAEIKEALEGLKVGQLRRLAEARGLVIGGSGKSGSITKQDYVMSIGAHMVRFPSHVRCRPEIFYHNGMIPGAAEWKQYEERILPYPLYEQVHSDMGDDMVVLERVNVIDLPEEEEEVEEVEVEEEVEESEDAYSKG